MKLTEAGKQLLIGIGFSLVLLIIGLVLVPMAIGDDGTGIIFVWMISICMLGVSIHEYYDYKRSTHRTHSHRHRR